MFDEPVSGYVAVWQGFWSVVIACGVALGGLEWSWTSTVALVALLSLGTASFVRGGGKSHSRTAAGTSLALVSLLVGGGSVAFLDTVEASAPIAWALALLAALTSPLALRLADSALRPVGERFGR